MPRKARILVPRCPHHIVQRGHNRKAVFVEDRDYQYYLDNIKEFKAELGIKLYAWCLMTNHVHLILEPADEVENLSQLMKRLAGRQSAFVNKLESRTGSLWEGRFKASPIQRDEYLLQCVRYIEMNPVRANMVPSLDAYKWSSYHERMGNTQSGMLDLDACFLGLASTAVKRKERYRKYIEAEVSEAELQMLRESVQRNQLTGNNRFVDEIETRTGLRVEKRGRGRPVIEK